MPKPTAHGSPSDMLRRALAAIQPGESVPCHIGLSTSWPLPWPVIHWLASDAGVVITDRDGVRHFQRPAVGATP